MDVNERERRKAEADLRQEELRKKTELELEKEKEYHKQKAQMIRNQRNLLEQQKEEDEEESLYEKEQRIYREQIERIAKGLPVNQSKYENLKGFDAELQEKMRAKWDSNSEENVCNWISTLTGEDVYDIYEALKSGKILCELLNKIKPGTIVKYNLRPKTLHERENIKLYLDGCRKLGLSSNDLFNLSDLHENRNISAVIQNIYALNQLSFSIPEFKGPYLEPKIGNIVPTNRPKRESYASNTGHAAQQNGSKTDGISSAPELKYISNPSEPKVVKKKKPLETASMDELLQTINERVLQQNIVLNINQEIVQYSEMWKDYLSGINAHHLELILQARLKEEAKIRSEARKKWLKKFFFRLEIIFLLLIFHILEYPLLNSSSEDMLVLFVVSTWSFLNNSLWMLANILVEYVQMLPFLFV